MTRGQTPAPIPDLLRTAPFEVATGRAAGMSAGRLRALDLDRRVYGVRAAYGTADDLLGRCRMFATRLGPETFFSHGTAALLLGAPLPWRLERNTDLHVTVPAPLRAPHASGLVGHSRRVLDGDVIERDGVRMSAPHRLVCELSRTLALVDLVAVIDALIHHREPLTTTEAILWRAAQGDRIGRGRTVPAALSLANDRSESRRETHLRVLLVLAGLPLPEIQHVAVRTETGVVGIRTDFAYPELKLAIEYQGDYHCTREQWRADMTRRTRLEADGWYILEINADDLRDPDELVARIRRIIALRQR